MFIISIPYLLVSLTGLFAGEKHFPRTDKFLKYAVIIPARNEGRVIRSAIDSIRCADRGEQIDIFVIAHNCTDDTADAAQNAGAQVFPYDNAEERTKGFAIRAFVDSLIRSGRIGSYDGYFIADADNLFRRDFFVRMNDAFVSEDKKSVINGYQNARNFGESLISSLYGVFQLRNVIQEHRPRTALNISTRIRGTAYLIPSYILKNGFDFTSLTEDWDFCGHLILNDVKIVHCGEAEFFDEQPGGFKVMIRQRFRWSAGYLYVIRKYFFRLIKALFSPEVKRKLSVYDFFASLVPYPVTIIFNDTLFLITALISTMFGVPFKAMMVRCLSIIFSKYLYFYIIECILTVRCFISERKHIRGVSFGRKVIVTFLYPLFYLIAFPLHVAALFSGNVTWKEIPHNSEERPDRGTQSGKNRDREQWKQESR